MRLFRKKADSPGHQEYLDGLITSIRKARRHEEEKPGLHAFVEEDDFYPAGSPSDPARVPPSAAKAQPETPPAGEEAEAVANLEAYLSALNAAEAAQAEEEAPDSDDQAV